MALPALSLISVLRGSPLTTVALVIWPEQQAINYNKKMK
jgi:hypothetical protein